MGSKVIDLNARANRLSMGGGDRKKHDRLAEKKPFHSACLVVEKGIEGKSVEVTVN